MDIDCDGQHTSDVVDSSVTGLQGCGKPPLRSLAAGADVSDRVASRTSKGGSDEEARAADECRAIECVLGGAWLGRLTTIRALGR